MSVPIVPVNDAKSLAFLLEALDSKQRLYVDARVHGSVPQQAARVAGYADPDAAAARLEKDSTVLMAVEVSLRMSVRKHAVTKEDVIAGLMDALRISTTATEQIAAWREIGKIVGAYEPTVININKIVTHKQEQLRQLPDTELAKLAGGAIDAEYEVLDFVSSNANSE
jgi:phage terminase small subunit